MRDKVMVEIMRPTMKSAKLHGVERFLKYDLPVSVVTSIEQHKSVIFRPIKTRGIAIGILISDSGGNKKRMYDGQIYETRFPLAYVELPGVITENLNKNSCDLLYFTYSAKYLPIIQERFDLRSSGAWPININSRLVYLIKQIKRLLDDPYKRGHVDLIDSYCQIIAVELMLYRHTFNSEIRTSEIEKKMEGVHLFLFNNYKNPPTIETLAARFSMSPRTLRRYWSKYYAESMKKFIAKRRISEAQHLLEQGLGNITQVAYEVGYDDPLYFSRIFHEIVGIAPSECLPVNKK